MKKQIKKPLIILTAIIVFTILVFFIKDYNAAHSLKVNYYEMLNRFEAMPYRALIVLAVGLLYTVPFLCDTVNFYAYSQQEVQELKEKRIRIRKWAFAIWIFLIVILVNVADSSLLQVTGKNVLGLSDLIGTFFNLSIVGSAIYAVVVSNKDFKLAFKDASVEGSEDMKVINRYEGSVAELTIKMNKQLEMLGTLNVYAENAIKTAQETPDKYKYLEEPNKMLADYLKILNGVGLKSITAISVVDMADFSGLGYDEDEQEILAELNSGESAIPKKYKNHYLMTFQGPFEVEKNNKLVIKIESKTKIMKHDEYVIANLLYNYEIAMGYVIKYKELQQEKAKVEVEHNVLAEQMVAVSSDKERLITEKERLEKEVVSLNAEVAQKGNNNP